jgi:alpha/beta superfamily hydrolase
VKILGGAEHFFHGRLTELRALLSGWLAARVAGNS